MKKLVILIIGVLVVSGCTDIKEYTYEDILNNQYNSPSSFNNIRRKGYSYYLPVGLKITNSDEYNEVITNNQNLYYLYVDIVSYFNKQEFDYSTNSKTFYSVPYQNGDKKGYLEINELENDKYLIEIMYNYAKIEVMVEEKDINIAIFYSTSILSSITYNNNIIENLMGKDVLNFSEEEFNIFKTTGTESNVLEMFENESDEKKDIPDTDLIN